MITYIVTSSILVVLPLFRQAVQISNKPFERECLKRVVDTPQRISLSDLESGQNLKDPFLEGLLRGIRRRRLSRSVVRRFTSSHTIHELCERDAMRFDPN
jgi:hypothetical protein